MNGNARLECLGGSLLKVHGALSFDSVPFLLNQGIACVEKSSDMTVDLSGVTTCDSAGLALLISWFRVSMRKKTLICFLHVPKKMGQLGSVSGLDDILPWVLEGK